MVSNPGVMVCKSSFEMVWIVWSWRVPCWFSSGHLGRSSLLSAKAKLEPFGVIVEGFSISWSWIQPTRPIDLRLAVPRASHHLSDVKGASRIHRNVPEDPFRWKVYIDYIDQKYAKVYGNYIYINVRTFKYTNWYFILPPDLAVAPPSTYLNVVTVKSPMAWKHGAPWHQFLRWSTPVSAQIATESTNQSIFAVLLLASSWLLVITTHMFSSYSSWNNQHQQTSLGSWPFMTLELNASAVSQRAVAFEISCWTVGFSFTPQKIYQVFDIDFYCLYSSHFQSVFQCFFFTPRLEQGLPSRSHLKAVLSSRWINHMETKKKNAASQLASWQPGVYNPVIEDMCIYIYICIYIWYVYIYI